MPFPKWAVEPVFLVRKPLPPDKSEPCNFYPIINASLVSCLRQLSSVAIIADRIFEEIGCECRLVLERTERIKDKIRAVNDVVSKLNARAVQVPVSDLNTTSRFLREVKPFVTTYPQSTHLFLPSTRPPCVDRLYAAASATPVPLMCTIDRYRTDGLSASDLFMVTPVLGGNKKRKKLLDIETRKPANFSLAATNQDRIESGSASLPPMVLPSRGYILKQNENLELERLPSPEEQAMLVSLEYPSTIVPVDTSGTSFSRMSLMRRSLIHVDFVIKHRRSKRKKSKRRHTFCEGQNRELEQAIRNVTNTSCQTDDTMDSSSTSLLRMSGRRRSRSLQDNSRRLIMEDMEASGLEEKDSATEEDKEASPLKTTATLKKSKTPSLRSRAFNPLSTLSAAISAVKMRTSTSRKQDDGRSSSGNWSASSSTRASVDSSTEQHAVLVGDSVSSPSRSSLGKDSLLSDATQQDPHNRSRDDILHIQLLTQSPVKKKKNFAHINLPWERNRNSSTPTPDLTSIRSPHSVRRGVISDDGDSSVYSVDTDGYYTSMHTDSGLWYNAQLPEVNETAAFRQRKTSQSSVSTNSSINSFLSKSATECSSNSESFKVRPPPPLRVSSVVSKDVVAKGSDKSNSPPNGSSNSESEHEVMDRIRYKTEITPLRYPSMCAVSPETSDDEMTDLKRRTVVPNVNVVVAEIHREEIVCDNKASNKTEQVPKPKTHPSSINMYRSETPVPSNFSSAIHCSQPISSSTPKHGVNITTFSSECNDTINPNTKRNATETVRPYDATSAEKLVSPLPKTDKTLIPLKYAQRITVTPIARGDESSASTGTIKRTPLKQVSSSEPKTDRPSLLSCIKTNTAPSYVSFKAPDSPVSSLASFKMCSEEPPTSPTGSLSRSVVSPTGSLSRPVVSPTGSLSRPVARVTLDPTGKVVYSSNSLERSRTSPQSSLEQPSYATLPMPQSNLTHRTANSIGNKCAIPVNNRCITPVNSRSVTLVSNNSTNSTYNRSSTPVSNSFAPNNNRSSTPVSHRSITPSSSRSTTPVNNISTTPTSSRSTTPVNNRSSTPVQNRSITPVQNRSMTPVQNRSMTPVQNRSITPIQNRSITPVQNRSITPIQNRSTTSIAVRSTPQVRINSTALANNRCVIPSNKTTNSESNRYADSVNNRTATSSNSSIYTNNRSLPINRSTMSILNRSTTPTRELHLKATQDIKTSHQINGCDKSLSKITIQPSPEQSTQKQPYQFSSFKSSNTGNDFNFRPSRGGRFCRSYFPSHLISSTSGQAANGNVSPTTSSPDPSPSAVYIPHHVDSSSKPSYDYSAGRNFPRPNSDTSQMNHTANLYQSSNFYPHPSNVVPNSQSQIKLGQMSPNTSIRPNRYHSLNNKHPESKSGLITGSSNSVGDRDSHELQSSLSPPDLIPSGQSPPSTLDVTSSARRSFREENASKDTPASEKKNIKNLSSNELFAIIHSSKKRHNIKSESELSMSPISSRSASPALSQSSMSKLQPVETGVLSRRYDNSPDRSKWCNSLPSSKKPMFPEKMGANKPTSMRDFKMLLLQTRTGSQDSSPRPSAAELLKVSPPKSTSPVPSSNFKSPASVLSGSYSPGNSPSSHSSGKGSYPSGNSPSSYSSSNGSYLSGHGTYSGTVPLKRNMRTRSPYLTRYDSAYPPIIEDCSEEMESCDDNSKCLASDNLPYKSLNNNYGQQSSAAPMAKATSTWV